MKALNKFTIFGLLLILISVGARADFTAGDFDLQVECCESVLTTYEFTNNYSQTLTYRLKSVGDGADWVNFNGRNLSEEELIFELNAGEAKDLYAFVNPCCYTKQGEYVIGIEYSSVKGTKTQEINVSVPECRTIVLNVDPERSVVGQCEKAVFEVKLSNQSIASENIELEIEGIASEWLEVDGPTSFILEKDGERTLNITVDSPCTAQIREYPGRVIAKIKDTEFSVSDKFVFEVEDKQGIVIGTAEQRDMEACNDLKDERTISIENNGRAKDALSLSIEGPEWVELKQKAVILDPDESKNVTVYLDKGEIEEKEFTFIMKAKSQIFNKETEQIFHVNVKDCFALGFGKAIGVEEACLEEGLEYEFVVENVKEKDSEIKVFIEGLTATIEPAEFSLKSGNEKTVKAVFDLTEETAGNKEFVVKVVGENFELEKSYVVKLNDCYAIASDHEEFSEDHLIEVGTQVCQNASIITSTVTNTGTKTNTVTITYTGPEWVLIQPTELTLAPGETKEFYAYFNAPITAEEGDFVVEANLTATDHVETAVSNLEVKQIKVELIDVTVESELEEEIVETSTTIKAKIHLKNTGNCSLEIKGMKAEGFEVEFDSTSFVLDINEERKVVATVLLGDNFEGEEVTVPVTIETDRGFIKKTVKVNLSEEEVSIEETIEAPGETTEAEGEEEEGVMPVGLATLGNTTVNMVILLFLAIVAVVIVILAYHTYTKPTARGKGKTATKKASNVKKKLK